MIDQHGSLAEKILKKGFWLYFFSFIIAPIGYLIKIIISGNIDTAELGVLYGVISLITLLSAFSDLGITESIKYFIPQFLENKDYKKIKSFLLYSLIIQFLSAILLTCIFYFGAEIIGQYYFKSQKSIEVIQVFSLFFFGINFFQTLQNFFLAVQDTFYYKLSEFIRISFIFLSILFFTTFDNTELYIYSYSWIIGLYIGCLFALGVFTIKFRRYFTKTPFLFSKSFLKQIFSYSIITFLSAQAVVILSQIDMQMIIFFLGNTEAGYYTVYLSLIMIPFLILGPIMMLLLPVFSELAVKNNFKDIKKIKQSLYNVFLPISIVFGLLLFIFSENISYIFFGENYIFSGEILRYSIFFLFFNFGLQINFNILGSLGMIKIKLYIILSAILLNIILNYIFISLIGTSGAALATGIGWLFIWICSEYTLGKPYFSKIDGRILIKNISFFLCISFLCMYYSKNILLENTRTTTFIILCCISILWILLFFMLNKNDLKSITQHISLKKRSLGK